MAELRVDEGDEEAFGVEQLGQLEHGVQVACGWVRDKHGVRRRVHG